MTQSDHQWKFLKDVSKFIQYCDMIGWKVTLGHGWRSPEEQQRLFDAGLSKAKPGQSQHEKRKAVDLNFWDEEGVYLPTYKIKAYHDAAMMKLANYWEDLDPKNRAGLKFHGFRDPYHFERMD
jgi:hypothetical protein